MAKDGTISEDGVIGSFQKSVGASVQVSVVDWQEDTYLDIRETVPGDHGPVFTKKGIRMKAELLPQLLELLQKV